MLTGHLFGVSPTAAREVAARVAGDPEAGWEEAAPDGIARTLVELFSPLDDGTWNPHVALNEEGDVIAFAPYELRQFEQTRAVPDISEAMWLYFEHRLTMDAYAAVRKRVRELIRAARSDTEHALEEVRKHRVAQEQVEALREEGELLLTYQDRIDRGAREITVPGYDGEPRTIELDPRLTAVENAQATFKRYRKAARAAKEIPARIRALEADLEYLEQLEADLALAESRPEIDAVHEALAEGGWTRKRPRQSTSAMVKGPRRFDIQGFPVFVGRNATQNDQVTFQRGSPDDLWLHVRGRPGAHVIIKSSREDVPDQVIEGAAALAAYYSTARESDAVDVDVTERRFVKRAPGRRPGLVTYRNERTVLVEPATIESPAGS